MDTPSISDRDTTPVEPGATYGSAHSSKETSAQTLNPRIVKVKLHSGNTSQSSEMPINFTCYGRQQYRGSNGGPAYLEPQTRPDTGPGRTAGDWAWKPSTEPAEVSSGLSTGKLRPNAPLWNEWAGLDDESAYEAKTLYSNLLYSDPILIRERLAEADRMMEEITEGYEDLDTLDFSE